METPGLSQCPSCQAVINVNWSACAVCKQSLHPKAHPSPEDWLRVWRELAQMSLNVQINNPHYEPVMKGLYRCDDLFLSGNWEGFKEEADNIKRLMRIKKQ